MAYSTIWWLLAGTAIGVELLTGTFYLLMVSGGLVAAALAAHAGVSVTTQVVLAALVGAGLVLAWRGYKQMQPAPASASANPDVNLDIGQTVQVDRWNADATASVHYRGANWTVACVAGKPPEPGQHRIVEVVGARLIVSPA